MAFCHLHVHSEYSLLDGLCRMPKLVNRASEIGMEAIALTDHGGLWGLVPFYKECINAGIKPIIGCEVYVVEDHKKKQGKENPYHLVLLCENEEGYKNLIKLVTASHLDGFYYRPRVDKKMLNAYSRGIIALSGCIKGEVSQLILQGKTELAEKAALEYAEIFGRANFFLELQRHGLPEEEKANFWLRDLSRKLQIGLVATNDVHYIFPEEADTHRVLLSVQTLSSIGEGISMPGCGYDLKCVEEMSRLFSDVPEALENAGRIADRCRVDIKLGGVNLPEIQVPPGYDTESYLEKITFQRAENIYGRPLSAEVLKRLSHELSIIKKTGFAGYFLVVKDITDFARRNGILVGVGRGSAAGSLVCYCLGITEVDPLKYGLIFERFLNPERVSPPDIDVDLCHRGRREVLSYLRKHYGQERIAHAGAFSTLQARAVLRDTGRALGLPYNKTDTLCSFIPYSHITLEEAARLSPHLSSMVSRDPQAARAFETARRLQGLPRHMTQHSAGVVIAQKPLTEYVALQRASGEEIITQADMDILEDLGLVKIDLLGLRFLTVIRDTLKLIGKRRGIHMTPNDIPLDDEDSFEALSRGDTTSTFQLESTGMRNLLKSVKPRDIKDLSAVLALYRPGPIKSGMTAEYIARRNGQKPVSYPHPCLEPVLSETYGVFLYQEQLMQTAHLVAGFTLGEADLLRRAVAKKRKADIEAQKPRFIDGARRRGIDAQTALQIFSILESFGDYGFNKSHSVAYAITAFRTVYLKLHFPLEYFSSLLSLYMDTPSRLQLYLSEARRRGIKLLRPDINKSGIGFIPEDCPSSDAGAIRSGFAMVKSLGARGIEEILKVRSFDSFKGFFDFCRRIDRRAVSIKAIESLILAGAFDSFGIPAPALLLSLKAALTEKSCAGGQICFLPEESISERLAREVTLKDFTAEQKAYHELEILGHYITSHPMELWDYKASKLRTHTVSDLAEISHKKRVCLTGILLDCRRGRTKSGKVMLFVQLEDLTGTVEVVVFPQVLKWFSPYISTGAPVLVQGWTDLNDDGQRTVIAEKISPL